MDKIEQLIKNLIDLKEELNKGKSLASSLKSHKGVQDVSIQRNHPDHPGHTSVSVKHSPEADDHVMSTIKQHGKITSEGSPYSDEHGHYHTQVIMKPHAPKEVKVKQLKAQVDAGTYKPDPKKIADKMIGKADEDHPATLSHEDVKKLTKEELTCSANGQWNLNKADYSKMPVRKITSAKAVSDHHYDLTHHFPDGKTTGPHRVKINETGIRLKTPNKTHAIHLKGQAEPVHTDEATAHGALKAGTFDFETHSKNALKKNNEELNKISSDEHVKRNMSIRRGNLMAPQHAPDEYSSSIADGDHHLHVNTGNGAYVLTHKNRIIEHGPDHNTATHPKVKELGKQLTNP